MDKKAKKPIAVISEGAVYRGIRQARAWCWVWHDDLAPRPASRNSDAVLARIQALLVASNLSKYDRQQCRKALAVMNAADLLALEASLWRYMRAGRQR